MANRKDAFLPIFSEIDRRLGKGKLIVVIEGSSASGKTTLGEMIGEIYGCAVLHMDDFFLRPEQRTPERYAQIGGNVDYERFLEEVLIPLKNGEEINYRRFDCKTMILQPAVKINPGKLTVIEGAYSMHPKFSGYYDFSVFLDISPELQRERILRRNTPEKAERFFNEWIPFEKRYFSETDVKKRCDLVLKIGSDN